MRQPVICQKNPPGLSEIALADCFVEPFANSVLLMHYAAKIFQDESFCSLTCGESFRMDTPALENVSQKNEPLIILRIAECFHQISH